MAIKLVETGEVLYQGAVFRVFNGASFQVMSDIWGSCTDVEVFDVAENRPKKLSYNFSDNGHVWSKAEAKVDITDDVWEKYRLWLINQKIEKYVNDYKNNDRQIVVGDTVWVKKGKTAKGSQGKVVFIKAGGPMRFGYSVVNTTSYCIALSDRTEKAVSKYGKEYDRHVDVAWVYARNCEKLNLTEPDMAEIASRAVEAVDYSYKRP
jgi:hypothetical protein